MFRKILFRSGLIVCFCLGAITYASYLKGLPPLQWWDFTKKAVGSLFVKMERGISLPTSIELPEWNLSEDRKPRAYYKWRDSGGTWYYGDKPPADALDVQTVTVNSNNEQTQHPEQ